ncbi:MAG: hypothetical protein LBS55_08000 [Prevotellaceae bacterium]|nr:hypothetical protein [Prevotellaceae bacterium]
MREREVINELQRFAYIITGNNNELNMFDIRKKADRVYRDIVERIEALSLIKR